MTEETMIYGMKIKWRYMIKILLLILLSSLWSILLHETPIFERLRKAKSGYKLISLILGAIQCKLCFSAHIFWITYFIIYGSGMGILLWPIPFFLTFIVEKYLFNVKL